jgi:ubiquinone/menaquinone biosynthesis C-methylase UbiE
MKTSWSEFYKEKILKIFTEKSLVLDVGGGLRVVKEKNNRYSPENEWIRPYLSKVHYRILDPVDTYHPDIVGDIHNLPMKDESEEAIICIAVLEHVENPIKAFEEMYRVLKPGGYLFVYVPFLYYYHAEKGYYGDFWRFTEDSLKWLSRDFSQREIMPVRGALETWIRLSPLGRFNSLRPLWHYLDKLTGKLKSKQVSGYHVFLIK